MFYDQYSAYVIEKQAKHWNEVLLKVKWEVLNTSGDSKNLQVHMHDASRERYFVFDFQRLCFSQ